MKYADNQSKFAVVVNRDVSPARLLNAVAHCCAGLAGRIGAAADFLEYPCPAEEWTANISRWPAIVLVAKNGGQIARFVREARARNLAMNCFTAAMLGADAEQQRRQVREDAKPEYWAAAAFGEEPELREITRRFSLYKGN
ncbi:MAG: DUF2000 family protein [Gammaproteobacteria bacterium]